MEKRCKNCKWFNHPKPIKNLMQLTPIGHWGACKQIASTSQDNRVFVASDEAIMVVGGDFGCVHFSGKAMA